MTLSDLLHSNDNITGLPELKKVLANNITEGKVYEIFPSEDYPKVIKAIKDKGLDIKKVTPEFGGSIIEFGKDISKKIGSNYTLPSLLNELSDKSDFEGTTVTAPTILSVSGTYGGALATGLAARSLKNSLKNDKLNISKNEKDKLRKKLIKEILKDKNIKDLVILNKHKSTLYKKSSHSSSRSPNKRDKLLLNILGKDSYVFIPEYRGSGDKNLLESLKMNVKKPTIVMSGDDYDLAGEVHEMGHAINPSGINKVISGPLRKFPKTSKLVYAGAVGLPAAVKGHINILDAARGDSDPSTLGAATGALSTGGLLALHTLPELYEEGRASLNAIKLLDKVKAPDKVKKNVKKKLLKAYLTYAAKPATIAALGSGAYLLAHHLGSN